MDGAPFARYVVELQFHETSSLIIYNRVYIRTLFVYNSFLNFKLNQIIHILVYL